MGAGSAEGRTSPGSGEESPTVEVDGPAEAAGGSGAGAGLGGGRLPELRAGLRTACLPEEGARCRPAAREAVVDSAPGLAAGPGPVDGSSTGSAAAQPSPVANDPGGPATDIKELTDALGIGVFDQDILEKDMMQKVDRVIARREKELEMKRLDKTQRVMSKLQKQLDKLEDDMHAGKASNAAERAEELEGKLAELSEEAAQIQSRMAEAASAGMTPASSGKARPGQKESEREMLIRTGKITPFEKVGGVRKVVRAAPASSFASAAAEPANELTVSRNKNLTGRRLAAEAAAAEASDESTASEDVLSDITDADDADFVLPDGADEEGGDFYTAAEDGNESKHVENELAKAGRPAKSVKKMSSAAKRRRAKQYTVTDDGNEAEYQKRLLAWVKKRRLKRARLLLQPSLAHDLEDDMAEPTEEEIEEEMHLPHPVYEGSEFDGGFSMPGDVHAKLFEYQRTCARWLWELHCQGAGGIIGDEMGLGKTVQAVAFLAGLHYSGLLDAPAIVVCPATVMKQWVKIFHRWWPPMRVVILHSSGSGMTPGVRREAEVDEEECQNEESEYEGDGSSEETQEVFDDFYEDRRKDKDQGLNGRAKWGRSKGKGKCFSARKARKKRIGPSAKTARGIQGILDRMSKFGHVLITTYEGARIYRTQLLPCRWSYAILDEGHKIRNPDADVTLTLKQLKTPHRIILSGTPIQNNLVELWSLFDFVFPGRLGTLPVFQSQFAVPINIGGYANASNVQVQTAYKCACVLRDLISPYLLRRMKADVATDLPRKSEQVLFCKLTDYQRKEYEKFLRSDELGSILDGKRHVLYGIDVLRKICNHPDLLYKDIEDKSPTYGHWEKSGKMLVVKAVLEMWHRDKHRVLLFSQTRQMLDILERLARTLGHQYRRMDGTTPVANRHALVDEFNARKDIFLFLLTTKVGGLGVNLTGADRVCIYDPDWNPSTDVQARERAWRLGQKKDVTIYRLMTSGTIEEKIYHRQIFKTFLTNKILKDPKQKRFFKSSDLNDLFSLTSEDSAATGTETGELFEGTEVVAPARPAKNKRRNSGEAGRPRTKRERRREGEADNLASIGELAGVEEYRPPGALSEPGGGEGGEERQSAGEDGHDDSHILESLFEMTGIHSALKHDSIMDGARQEDIIVEREAARVAEEAVLALKESRKRRRAQDIGVPTWTGRSGSAGGPRFGTRTSGPRFLLSAHPSSLQRSTEGFGSGALSGFRGLAAAPSSSSVLSNMKHRSAPGDRRRQPGDRTAKSGGSGEAIEAKLMDESKRENLVVKIREFLCLRGEAGMSSSEIVENFKLRIRDEDVPMFRKMLRGIADFHREADGNGYWKLKADFL